MSRVAVMSWSSGRILFVLSVVSGVTAFSWPFIAAATWIPHGLGASAATLLAVGAVALALLWSFWRVNDPRIIALIGVLAALAAVARLLSLGAGGIEFIFVVVILAGRVLGPRAGFAVGAIAIAASSMLWGGFGPWTAFQMLAVGWVAVGAGMIPHRGAVWGPDRLEIPLLAAYGVISSYVFGWLMNLWFWPITIGGGTSLSLVDGDSVADNLSRFVLYSLTTSTLTWDTVRAITTVLSVVLIGSALLAALRRVAPPRVLDREVLRLGVVEHERVS